VGRSLNAPQRPTVLITRTQQRPTKYRDLTIPVVGVARSTEIESAIHGLDRNEPVHALYDLISAETQPASVPVSANDVTLYGNDACHRQDNWRNLKHASSHADQRHAQQWQVDAGQKIRQGALPNTSCGYR
jgi:hypothetical protein